MLVWEVWIVAFATVSWNLLVLDCRFLRTSRVICSFWKSGVSLFVNVRCNMHVLEVWIVTFCECVVENTHFGSLDSRFLRMSHRICLFWKLHSHFL